jgi:hypothetical protein
MRSGGMSSSSCSLLCIVVLGGGKTALGKKLLSKVQLPHYTTNRGMMMLWWLREMRKTKQIINLTPKEKEP